MKELGEAHLRVGGGEPQGEGWAHLPSSPASSTGPTPEPSPASSSSLTSPCSPTSAGPAPEPYPSSASSTSPTSSAEHTSWAAPPPTLTSPLSPNPSTSPAPPPHLKEALKGSLLGGLAGQDVRELGAGVRDQQAGGHMFADELGNLGLGAAAQLGPTWGAGWLPWLCEGREGFTQGLAESVSQAQPAPWTHWGNGEGPAPQPHWSWEGVRGRRPQHRPWGSPGSAGRLTSVRR